MINLRGLATLRGWPACGAGHLARLAIFRAVLAWRLARAGGYAFSIT
jgi:hypothetical protein